MFLLSAAEGRHLTLVKVSHLICDAAGLAEPTLQGVVRPSADPDNKRAEYAVLVHAMTGLEPGPVLMRRIIDYARQRVSRSCTGKCWSTTAPY